MTADIHAPTSAFRHTGPPASPEHVRAVMGELTRRLGWRSPHHQATTPATTGDAELVDAERVRAVACPYCGVGARRDCEVTIRRGRHRGEHHALTGFHASRVETALTQIPVQDNGNVDG